MTPAGPLRQGAPEVFSFAADTASLADLGDFLRASCAAHPQPPMLELAVTEAVVNTIKHGGALRCRVEVCSLPGRTEILLCDNGVRFDPLEVEPGPLGELREGGYGLAIIKRVASSLSYARQDGWNRLSLTFKH